MYNIQIQVNGFSNPTIHQTVESALDELREVLRIMQTEDPCATVTIKTRRMTEEQYAALPESSGY